MRRCLHILMLLSLGCASALAQERFSSRPITLVCPFPPGGTTDVLPRVVAPALYHQFVRKDGLFRRMFFG